MDILSFLKRKGLNQTALAELLNVDSSAVGNWVNGKNTPKYAVAEKLLLMGMRIDELYSPEVWETVKKTHFNDMSVKSSLNVDDCIEIVKSGMMGILQNK